MNDNLHTMKRLKKPLGIMFHHMHNSKENKSLGSISSNQFEKILKKISLKKICNPSEFIKAVTNRENNNKLCITFDDSLKSQFNIAIPILRKFNLKAFWFIPSNTLKPKKNNIELYRIFREKKFKNFENFYSSFLNFLNKIEIKKFLKKKKELTRVMKRHYNFYSNKEIKFRLIRDIFLKKYNYDNVMAKMFKKYNFNWSMELKNIFLNRNDIQYLVNNGHEVGLHSHTHPTKISLFPKKKQEYEYTKNKILLEKITKKKIVSMSHPSGDYNKHSLQILKKNKIKIGFISNKFTNGKFDNDNYFINLLIPRIDHFYLK